MSKSVTEIKSKKKFVENFYFARRKLANEQKDLDLTIGYLWGLV
jgi:hypothetical protein